MTVEEKIEEIIMHYKCNDVYGDGCDGDCENCGNELRNDLLELVDLAYAKGVDGFFLKSIEAYHDDTLDECELCNIERQLKEQI